MTSRSSANLRSLVTSAILLALLGLGCQSHSAKSKDAVSVDLTRLQLPQNDPSLPAQISLVPIKSVRSLPDSVRARIPKMSNPGGLFNAGCVSILCIPSRRLIFGGISDRYCLVHYEYGGFAHGYTTALFAVSGSQSAPLWVHGGIKYASLELFAKETNPDELTNQLSNGIVF